MDRPAEHKRLIAAIIDSEVDAQGIVDRAAELGETIGERLTAISKGLIKARLARKISPDRAHKMFLYCYRALALGGFAAVAQDTQDHASGSTKEIMDATRALGAEVTKVSAITKLDKMAREVERSGELTNAE
jgi:hypothetical protein